MTHKTPEQPEEQAPQQAPEPQAGGAAQEAGETKPKGPKKHKTPKQDPAALAALEQQLADSQQQNADLQDKLLRTAAEYDNFRRRSQKEHDTAFGNGVSYAVLEMLPIVDTLEAAATAESSDEEYKKGVLMTLAKTTDVLKKLDVTEIEALGQPFDPEVHNAVMQHSCDGYDCGIVSNVIQKGYKIGDKVLRHAMVGVAP